MAIYPVTGGFAVYWITFLRGLLLRWTQSASGAVAYRRSPYRSRRRCGNVDWLLHQLCMRRLHLLRRLIPDAVIRHADRTVLRS
jgi:hypothetical protein